MLSYRPATTPLCIPVTSVGAAPHPCDEPHPRDVWYKRTQASLSRRGGGHDDDGWDIGVVHLESTLACGGRKSHDPHPGGQGVEGPTVPAPPREAVDVPPLPKPTAPYTPGPQARAANSRGSWPWVANTEYILRGSAQEHKGVVMNYIDQDEQDSTGTEILGAGAVPGNQQMGGQADQPPTSPRTDIFPSVPDPAAFPKTQTPTPRLGVRFQPVNTTDFMIYREQPGDDPHGVKKSPAGSNCYSGRSSSPMHPSRDGAPACCLSTPMTSQSGGSTDGQFAVTNKQDILSDQLLRMTPQERAEWMAKKERETRNRLRREGRDKGFREQALFKYVNDRIQEPSKSDWPGLNKCPIEHARNMEEKRAKRREMERGLLARRRRISDTSR